MIRHHSGPVRTPPAASPAEEAPAEEEPIPAPSHASRRQTTIAHRQWPAALSSCRSRPIAPSAQAKSPARAAAGDRGAAGRRRDRRRYWRTNAGHRRTSGRRRRGWWSSWHRSSAASAHRYHLPLAAAGCRRQAPAPALHHCRPPVAPAAAGGAARRPPWHRPCTATTATRTRATSRRRRIQVVLADRARRWNIVGIEAVFTRPSSGVSMDTFGVEDLLRGRHDFVDGGSRCLRRISVAPRLDRLYLC